MPVIDITKDRREILASAINGVSHDIKPEFHPEPLTAIQLYVFGTFEDYITNLYGWKDAKSIKMAANPNHIDWENSSSADFKFSPANVGEYFNGHLDVSWLTADNFTDGVLNLDASYTLYDQLIALFVEKGINWTSLMSDIQLPFVQYDTDFGIGNALAFHFTANVLVGPIFIAIPTY